MFVVFLSSPQIQIPQQGELYVHSCLCIFSWAVELNLKPVYLISSGPRVGVHGDFEAIFFRGDQSRFGEGFHTGVVLTRT